MRPGAHERVAAALCGARTEGQAGGVLQALVDALLAEGLPLSRASTALHALGPEWAGVHLIWVRGKPIQSIPREATIRNQQVYLGSAPHAVIELGVPEVHVRLDGPRAELPYKFLDEMADAGATDYLCFPLDVRQGLSADTEHAYWGRQWISFATDEARGFSDDEVMALRALLPLISLRCALEASKLTARALLASYLGGNASRRILGGAFRRGTAETLHAVIWYCDMQGFTTLSDVRPAREVVEVLDAYFDAVASPVDQRGGEVLKFIGDAILAIFPVSAGPGEGMTAACARALAAVADVRANLERLNRERAGRGEAALGLGIALHQGEVSYGNIGAQNRLDFTVIGAVVNEACRVEAMTRTLGVDVLLTESFVRVAELPADAVVPLGAHRLKGVSGAVELYGLPKAGAR